ncbi:MAG TPA: MATE family efflux transporter [Thermoguttaceae bacterium]|nr:MATE family efflux transporter [Thermoguttaceae bacterium]
MPTSRSDKLENQGIGRLLLDFSVPAIIGMMVHATYNIVDRIFIGQAVGSLGISAITVTFPIMLVLMAFGMLIGLGATALVSIRLGQRNKEDAERILGNAFVLLIVVNAVVGLTVWFSLHPILRMIGASHDVLPMAEAYARIILMGAVFQGIGFGLNNIIRGEGSPRIAMATMLIGALLNIVLDALFIFGFGMGVRGAALATVLSQMTTAAWVLGYFVSGRSLLRLHWAHLRPRMSLCWSICAIGSAPFAMQIAASLIITVFNRQLGVYGGDLAISVFGIVHSMAMMVMMPVFGISQGAQPIIGFNYGAEKYDRVKKTLLLAAVTASAVTTIGFVVAMASPASIVRLFDEKDAKLIELGSHAIRCCFLVLPIIGFQIVGANYFQAVGKPKSAMFLSLSRQVILLLPGLILWPRLFGLGLDGVWLALPVSDLGASILTAVWLTREIRGLGRKHRDLTEQMVPLDGISI